MSWFDPSSFSSFAKTALSQAQNLQKSIDKVLDIQEIPNGTASNSSASSQQKSAPVPVSGDSAEETLTTRKSSTSLSTTSASKSSKKTSLGVNNSKDSDSEGNSFWSSFLGDSFPNAESKTSSRKTSGRKLGSRVSGNRIGGSDNRNECDSTSTSNGQEKISSVRVSKQQDKKHGISQTDTTKSDEHLEASSHALLSQHQSTTNDSKELSLNQNKNEADAGHLYAPENANSEKVDYNTQEVAIAPAESETKAISERLKPSPGKSRKGKKKPLSPETDARKSHDNSSLQDVSTVKNSELLKEKRSNAGYKGPQSLSELEAPSPNTDPVYSKQNEKSAESQKAVQSTQDASPSNRLSTQVVVEGFANAITKSVSSDHDESSVVDPVDNAAISDIAVHDIQQEPSEQNKVFDVKPLASSTPNRHAKEQSVSLDKRAKPELMPPQPPDDNLNQNEDPLADVVYESKSPVSNIIDNKTISENVSEMFVEAVSIAEIKKSAHNIPKQEIEEIACEESAFGQADQVPLQLASTNSDKIPATGIIREEAMEEKESSLMQNHANSTENSEDLKRQIEELKNEVANLKHVIEVRESKLVEVSKENVDLEETSAILRSQLKQAEAALKAEDEEIEEVRQEFTVRVTATEKKYQAAAKERDLLKKLLEETEQSLSSKNDRQSEEFTTLLTEKDDQIAQLLEEGEKLSKQQLQSNNIVKKLRNKEKENDALIKKNSKLLEDATSENEKLTEILQVKDETERKQADAIKQLNAYVEKQETQISKLKSELDDSAEKIRSMQTALDNAYKQLADLHKENASKDSAVQEAALSAEMTAKEGLRIAMEKKERQFKNEIEALEFQISDLQTGLRRGEQQANRREDNLRQEISDLQQRLQEAEVRNQELTESVTFATRPLLRQIENLQSSYGNHTQTWERVERNLTERLNEAQIQLVEAQEKERVATEHALELNSRVTAVETQLATYRQDKSRLEATLEVERARLEAAEEARSREAAKCETLEIKYRKMMEDNNVEKALLEQQLAVERGKMETEKKKFQHAIDEKERMLLRQSSVSGAPPSPSAREEFSQVEVPEASPHRTLGRQSSGTSVIDGISRGIMGAGTAMIERLQAQVKQKDGEILLLQEEIASLQKTRDAVTEELTVLTSKLESLEEDSRLFAELQTRHKELEQRHNAVLQMYGEKAEQAEELRMDLEDVKSMYKSQIQELLGASR